MPNGTTFNTVSNTFTFSMLADQIASEAVGWGRGDVAVGIPAHADAVVVILPFGAIGNAVVGVSERVEGEIHDVRNARSVQSMI